MTNHLKILGILYLAFGILGAVVAAILLNSHAGHLSVKGVITMFASTSGFVSVIAFFLAVEALPALITGVALLKRWFWARFSAMALGFFSLLIVPLGTALGIYTLWVVINDKAFGESNAELKESLLPRVFPPYH
jgi:hypothetical protein